MVEDTVVAIMAVAAGTTAVAADITVVAAGTTAGGTPDARSTMVGVPITHQEVITPP